MSQPLTDRNGVVCKWCFATVDLTNMAKSRDETIKKHRELNKGKNVPTPYGPILYTKERMTGIPTIAVTCPVCNRESHFDYSEIKPLAPSWESQKQLYESKLSIAHAQRDRAVADAKRLAELAHQEYPTEDFEEIDQVSASPNAPTPPEGPSLKKKDDKLPYT